jgi:2-hydroxycyclohexanecarboxyl-CoA dehydrogenase
MPRPGGFFNASSENAPVSDILSLDGRTALITGAGQGIGRETALLFAAHGVKNVVVNDFHAERAEAVAAELRKDGVAVLPVQCDVTDYAAVAAMMRQAQEAFGGIDILVNNAGNAGPGLIERNLPNFWEVGPEDWDRWLGPNLFGVLNCCHAAVPGMIERGYGRLVTVISEAGRVGEPSYVVYSGAKAGAAGFMRSVARSLGRYGITANSVAIALTATPAVERTLNGDPERLKRTLEKYIIRRPGRPDDIANMVQFLASDASPWITGQVYPVNGGFSFAL